ncbi:MAG: N-acetyltransferase [Acidimicrobiia bacterium]|nr:N-acetyltransferase [Acidimicrobiia bacterium]
MSVPARSAPVHPSARVHPTAELEPGVEIGPRTAIWGGVHARGPARIGAECIVGEKTYLAYGVEVGDRVKINAMVYVCTGVTLEQGVMVGAGTVFTNDRFPRATSPDLTALRPSDPDERTLPTRVREGATVGAGSVVGCGLEIGRFAMVGMGAVVTRSVPDFHLAVGHPARSVGCVCRCGEPFLRFPGRAAPDTDDVACPACGLRYAVESGAVRELTPPGP